MAKKLWQERSKADNIRSGIFIYSNTAALQDLAAAFSLPKPREQLLRSKKQERNSFSGCELLAEICRKQSSTSGTP